MHNKRSICAYCGDAITEVTVDHVIPSLLWGGKGHRPASPVMVPTCEHCRLLYDVDSEYFRNHVVSMIETGTHSVVDRLAGGKVARSVQRSNKIHGELFKNLTVTPKLSDDGSIVGTEMRTELDIHRFNRIIEKIVRGIYFAKSGEVFPTSDKILIYPGSGFWQTEGFQELFEAMRPTSTLGDDVFGLRFLRCEHGLIYWLLIFYGELAFFVRSGPPQ